MPPENVNINPEINSPPPPPKNNLGLKIILIIVLIAIVILFGFYIYLNYVRNDEPAPGGIRDIYGCWSPSGEHWCAAQNKCLQKEENCEVASSFTPVILGCGDKKCVKGENLKTCPADCLAPIRPPQSSVIASVSLETKVPITFKNTHGDLWFSTWADNNKLYMSWGDGNGFDSKTGTDLGIAEVIGVPPNLTGTNIFVDPIVIDSACTRAMCKAERQPACCLAEDDKPSSLLYVNNKLYGQFHSPLGDSIVGYIAESGDYGRTWTKYKNNSPWTRINRDGSNFRSMFFINMGQNYSLNTDGYVYAYGIGKEWMWESGAVYLTRVKKEDIADYNAYTYFSGMRGLDPIWSLRQKDSVPVQSDLIINEQFSAIYHPGLNRYLIMAAQLIYDAPTPWGPWTTAGVWVRDGWYGYQPGIISKDLGTNSFWFTIAGQPQGGGDDISYKLNLGKIILNLK